MCQLGIAGLVEKALRSCLLTRSACLVVTARACYDAVTLKRSRKMTCGWLQRGVALVFLGIFVASVAPGVAQAQGSIEPEKLDSQVLKLLQSGKYAEATEIAKRSLALKEELYGRDHPEVATALINLGLLL